MAKRNLILIIILLYSPLPSYPYETEVTVKNNNIVEIMEFGELNWTKGNLSIESIATLPEIIKNKKSLKYQESSKPTASDLAQARKIAKKEAYENAYKYMYNAVMNLRMTHETTLENYLLNNTNNLKFSLNNFLSQNIKKQYIYNKDDTISAKLSIDLYGSKGLITLFTNKIQPPLVPFYSQSNYRYYISQIETPTNIIPQLFTSLIIDASDIRDLKPALFPTLYNESSQFVYSSRICEPLSIIKKGFITYVPDITYIKYLTFVDDKSYMIKAVSSMDQTDLRLPNENISPFFSDKKSITYLQQGNVVIIMRP